MNTGKILVSFLDNYVDSWMRETQPEWREVRWYWDTDHIVISKGIGKDVRVARVSLSNCWTYDKGLAFQLLIDDIRRACRDWLTPRERWLAAPEPERPKAWRRFEP